MAGARTVRLRNVTTGVVVETATENADRLAGFEPVKVAAPKRSVKKSDDE